MEKSLFTLSFGFALVILATQHGFAEQSLTNPQNQCAPRAAILAALDGQYDESRHAIAMAGTGLVMELFVNQDTATWTMTATRADGITCLIASGQQYQTLPAAADGAPA